MATKTKTSKKAAPKKAAPMRAKKPTPTESAIVIRVNGEEAPLGSKRGKELAKEGRRSPRPRRIDDRQQVSNNPDAESARRKAKRAAEKHAITAYVAENGVDRVDAPAPGRKSSAAKKIKKTPRSAARATVRKISAPTSKKAPPATPDSTRITGETTPAVKTWITRWLKKNPDGGRSSALRSFRDSGLSCAQNRFFRTFQEVVQ